MTYGGLELKMFGNRKYETATEKLENESRRNFLGTTAKGVLALGLTGTGFLKSNNAHAYNVKDLPPGFWPEVCKDDKIRDIFSTMYFQFSNEYTYEEMKNILMRQIGLTSRQVSKNSPLTEPAYWFTIGYYNFKYQPYGGDGMINFEDLRFMNEVKQNLSMYNFALGINKYFLTWVDKRKKYGSILETETYLLRAIFTASGKSESEVEDYKKYDLAQKERYLQTVMKNLEKQSYTNQLIAAWGSVILNSHLTKQNNINEALIINKEIEIPIRNYIPKIRGPPYYPGL